MAQRPLAVAAADLHLDMVDQPNSDGANGRHNHADGYDGANGHSTADGDPRISWPLGRPTEPISTAPGANELPQTFPQPVISLDELLPGRKRSLSGISIRAFLLGATVGSCIPLAVFYGLQLSPPEPARAWRIFFLLATLSTFHFLEFWTHARFNVPKAEVASFILFNNGWQYTCANAVALLETVITSIYFPAWQAKVSSPAVQAVALVVLIVGQTVRSVAMAQAGTNFNHKVQTKRNEGHRLVSTGIYAWLRHPSYFGFFWWAVALQLFLGNMICFWVYLVVLWEFFHSRIAHEEDHLLKFFGEEYQKYRERTRTGIPFIR